jgi:hypothetical protein
VFPTGKNEELIEIIRFLYLVSLCSQKYRSYWARSKGRAPLRAPLFLVSKQMLNLSNGCIWCIKNHQKQIRIEKVIAPQSREAQELQKKKQNKTNHQTLQSLNLITQRNFKMNCRTEDGAPIAL